MPKKRSNSIRSKRNTTFCVCTHCWHVAGSQCIKAKCKCCVKPYGHINENRDDDAKRQVGNVLAVHRKQIEENKMKRHLRYDPAKEIHYA